MFKLNYIEIDLIFTFIFSKHILEISPKKDSLLITDKLDKKTVRWDIFPNFLFYLIIFIYFLQIF